MRNPDIGFSEILKNIRKRIVSVAKLHQHLYESEILQNLELKPYLEDLLTDIIQGVTDEDKVIVYVVKGDNPVLLESKMIYVGLLINGLLTNSLKHAFRKQDKGTIRIEISQQQNNCIIHYSDNGGGLSADFGLDDEESLGGRLIKNFTTQLEGKIEFYNDNGAHFRIEFPLNETVKEQ